MLITVTHVSMVNYNVHYIDKGEKVIKCSIITYSWNLLVLKNFGEIGKLAG